MRLVIEKTAADVGEWAAKYIKKKITDFNPGPDRYFTLGLPTGLEELILFTYFLTYYKKC